MSRYSRYDDYGFAPYVSVGEKRARNRKAAAKLRKQNEDVQPVVIEGRSIARTWWGKSWNANLERYADYSNRIGRGRSYVRHGAVLDLRLAAGRVNALVQGSRGSPYEVTVTIRKLPGRVWEALREESLRQVDSLSDLLAGEFPKALKDAFFAQGTGLFPAPKEIEFACSCPDWASMCKHVAAVLYGIGNRLDSAPELLFTLRQVTVDELIAHTVDAAAGGLISKAEQAAGDDVLAGVDLGDVFGIQLDDGGGPAVDLPPPATTKAARKSRGKRQAGKAARSTAPAAPRKRKASGKHTKRASSAAKSANSANSPATTGRGRRKSHKARPPVHGRMLDQLLDALGTSRAGFTTTEVRRLLPDWTRLQVANTIQRALSDGLLKRLRRGTYRRT